LLDFEIGAGILVSGGCHYGMEWNVLLLLCIIIYCLNNNIICFVLYRYHL
jgi:hypothetical protein